MLPFFRFKSIVDLVLSVGLFIPAHQAEIDIEGLELAEERKQEAPAASPEATESRQSEVGPSDHPVSQIQASVEKSSDWADAFQVANESADNSQKGHSDTNGNHCSAKTAAEKDSREEGSSVHSSADDGGGGQEASSSEDSWGDSFQEAASDVEPEPDAQPASKTLKGHSMQEAEPSNTTFASTEDSSTAPATTAEPENVDMATAAVEPPPTEAGSSLAVSRESQNGSAGDAVSPASPQPSAPGEAGTSFGSPSSTKADLRMAEDEETSPSLRVPEAMAAQPEDSGSRRLEGEWQAVASGVDASANLGYPEKPLRDGADSPEPSTAPVDSPVAAAPESKQKPLQEDSGAADIHNDGSDDDWGDNDDAWGGPALQEAPGDGNKPAPDAASGGLCGELAEQPLPALQHKPVHTETRAPSVHPDAHDKLQDTPRNVGPAEEDGHEDLAEAALDTSKSIVPSRDVLESDSLPASLHLKAARQACLEVGQQLFSRSLYNL